MGDIMRVIKRIMVFVSLLLITYFVFYVAVPAFIISGGIKPSAEKVGFIFCPDGNAFEHGYTVQIKNLGNGWYLYEENFANWKCINEEKVG